MTSRSDFTGKHFNPADHGRLACVDLGDDQSLDLPAACLDRDWERAANASDPAIEREFADEYAIQWFLFVEPSISAQNSESHGQIKARTFLADVGRCQIHGDVRGRDIVSAIAQRRANAVPTFPDCRVRKSHSMKVILVRLDSRDVNFHLDDVRVDSVDSGAVRFVEHG